MPTPVWPPLHWPLTGAFTWCWGPSGLNAEQLQTLDTMSREHGIGIIVAPNFALGAVVLKKLAEQAAAFFDYVDVVEAHHEMKIDAPSGFSLAIARGNAGRAGGAISSAMKPPYTICPKLVAATWAAWASTACGCRAAALTTR